MSWLYLGLAILTEVAGTVSMRLSDGFKRWLPSVMLFVLYGVSLGFETLALKRMDVSIVYAVWAGLGTALVATVGILWFKEPLTLLKLSSIVLIVVGVIGLSVTDSLH